MKAFLAAILLATPAHADRFCQQLDALFEDARSIELPLPFGTASTCSTALSQSGTTSTHCAWPFEYRAPKAAQIFGTLIDAVPTCLSARAVADDPDVNHPDFYNLRVFETAKGEVGVSLKDKGALQKTYIFLRVTPAG